MPPSEIRFGPYRLDPAVPRLLSLDQPVPLQPKPLAVLAHLAARPGAVVSRDELIRAIWAGTFVTKAVIKVAVRAIREALGDDAGAPRFIETVGREGYRFIAGDTSSAPATGETTELAAPAMVGRERDVKALHARFAEVCTGKRAVTFVTGEAGIGKTTLVDRFVAEVARDAHARIGRGQCLEQYGVGEAYLPILEALAGLLRGDAGPELTAVLHAHAPSWVPVLPAVQARDENRTRTGTLAPHPDRMLRECADAFEQFTRRQPLVLVLEDLQWSDPSTIDWLARIARRRGPAQLMVLGTFRPTDVIVHEHPLRVVEQDLLASGLCETLALELLSPADVADYVAARLGLESADETRQIASLLYERTEGNALFMVSVLQDFVARGFLERRDGRWYVEGGIDRASRWIPVGLQELLARQMRRLTPVARRTLEAASVAGDEFAVAAVAAALDDEPEAIEDVCEALASEGDLIADEGLAEWPDGSITGRYRFRHALYRRVLYDAIGEARRVRMHRKIGLREETGFAGHVDEHAAHLAMHFTRGRDHARALQYHSLAAAIALDRHAPHEAVSHFGAALDALAHEPAGRARDERELGLVVANATLLMAIRGYSAPETEQGFARARELCDRLPASPQLYPVVRGLVSYYHVRAELAAGYEAGELLLRLAADNPDDRKLRVQAHYGHGATLFHMGRFDEGRLHLEAALRDYDAASHRDHVTVYGGFDPGVACTMWLAWTAMLQGRLDDASRYDAEGLMLARRQGDEFTLAWACTAAGITQQHFGDWDAAERLCGEGATLAKEHGFPYVHAFGSIWRGRALVRLGQVPLGIRLLREGLAGMDAIGSRLARPWYLAMLGEAEALEGDGSTHRFQEALAALEHSGERFLEPIVRAGMGAVLSRTGAEAAEACLRRAVDVAAAHGIRLVELRAAVALARHLRAQGRDPEGLAILSSSYAPFVDARIRAPEIVAARELLGAAR